MMDLKKQIVGDILEKQLCSIDRILEEAFLEHFGFLLRDVQDRENLEHIIVQGDPIESFRYRGETFLYWNREMKIDIEHSDLMTDVRCTTEFKKV